MYGFGGIESVKWTLIQLLWGPEEIKARVRDEGKWWEWGAGRAKGRGEMGWKDLGFFFPLDLGV